MILQFTSNPIFSYWVIALPSPWYTSAITTRQKNKSETWSMSKNIRGRCRKTKLRKHRQILNFGGTLQLGFAGSRAGTAVLLDQSAGTLLDQSDWCRKWSGSCAFVCLEVGHLPHSRYTSLCFPSHLLCPRVRSFFRPSAPLVNYVLSFALSSCAEFLSSKDTY